MKKRLPTPLKDAITGVAMGTAVIIPGISGGTIALIFGAIDKITKSVRNLFSKDFWHNLLVLLPFIFGAVLAVAALYIPFDFALKNIKFSLVCLFAGLIAGSFPIITFEVRNQKPSIIDWSGVMIGLIISVFIGVFSVIFHFSSSISTLFCEIPTYLFLIVFGIGIISAAGLIVPGLSGSLILLVVGFYQNIFELFRFKNGWKDFGLLVCFAFGVLIGFILWSILMNKVLTKHRRGTLFVIIGFVLGSLFAIFYNSGMVEWYQNDKFKLLEWILGPCLAIFGFIISFAFSKYAKNNSEITNAKN